MATSTNSSSGLKQADQILLDAANTYAEKNAVYGDNFRNFPATMMGFFPDGIMLKTYEDWMRMQFFFLLSVKMSRYANNFQYGGHADSARDMAIYAAMMESTDAEFNYYRADQKSKSADGDNRGA